MAVNPGSPERLEVAHAAVVYERYCSALESGQSHGVALSMATLRQLSFQEKQTRSDFFNSNCHLALQKCLQRLPDIQQNMPTDVFKVFISDLLTLMLNISQDQTSFYCFLAAKPVASFNDLQQDVRKLTDAIVAARSLVFSALRFCIDGFQTQSSHAMKSQYSQESKSIQIIQATPEHRIQALKIAHKLLQNSATLNACKVLRWMPESLLELFRLSASTEDRPENLFRYNIVTKELRPNAAAPQSAQVQMSLLLECMLLCAGDADLYSLPLECLGSILTHLQYPVPEVYRPVVFILSELTRQPCRLQVLQNLQQDVVKQQSVSAQTNKMSYRNHYRSISRICGLLSSGERPVFLRTAARILASVTETDRGDEVLRDAGVIQPIMQLLSAQDDQSRLAACDIVAGICERQLPAGVLEDEQHAEKATVNTLVASDLQVCLPSITEALRKHMWALRRQHGETDPTLTQKQQEYEAEQRRRFFAGDSPNASPMPQTDITTPMEPIIIADPMEAHLLEYRNTVSQLLHAAADILVSDEAAQQFQDRETLVEISVFFLGVGNWAVSKWAAELLRCILTARKSLQGDRTPLTSALFSALKSCHAQLTSPRIEGAVAEACLMALVALFENAGTHTVTMSHDLRLEALHWLCSSTHPRCRTCAALLVAQLATDTHTAHIFIQHGALDYLALLSFQFQVQGEALIRAACAAIASLLKSAPIARGDLDQNTPQGSSHAEQLGKRGAAENVARCLERQGELSRDALQAVVNAVGELSKAPRNCLIFFQLGSVEALLKLIEKGGPDVQCGCANAIFLIRGSLASVMALIE